MKSEKRNEMDRCRVHITIGKSDFEMVRGEWTGILKETRRTSNR